MRCGLFLLALWEHEGWRYTIYGVYEYLSLPSGLTPRHFDWDIIKHLLALLASVYSYLHMMEMWQEEENKLGLSFPTQKGETANRSLASCHSMAVTRPTNMEKDKPAFSACARPMKLLFCYCVFKKCFNLFIVYMHEKILELQPQLLMIEIFKSWTVQNDFWVILTFEIINLYLHICSN